MTSADLSRHFLLSLDVELFFGPASGTPERCLYDPLDALLAVCDRTGLKLTLFVDAGYLVRASELAANAPAVDAARSEFKSRLSQMAAAGHDIQLHVHPHWVDATWNENSRSWSFDHRYYRLHEMPAGDQIQLVRRQQQELEDCSAGRQIFAYRAGGWCMQPFSAIRAALQTNGIWLDSTVFPGGHNPDPSRYFDFRNAPRGIWRFDDDPLTPSEHGEFVEVPISSVQISPLFFWQMALSKVRSTKALKPFGDGQVLANEGGYYASRLTRRTLSPVSIDGMKGRLLETSYREHQRLAGGAPFNVMGHPKSLTKDSLDQLERFLGAHSELELATLTDVGAALPPHLNPRAEAVRTIETGS